MNKFDSGNDDAAHEMADEKSSIAEVSTQNLEAMALNDLNVSESYDLVYKILCRELGESYLVKDVIELSEHELLKLNGVGSGKLQTLLTFQNLIREGAFDKENEPDLLEGFTEQQLTISFRKISLPSEHLGARNTLLRNLGENALLRDVLTLSEPELRKLKGVGQGKFVQIQALKNVLKTNTSLMDGMNRPELASSLLALAFEDLALPSEHKVAHNALLQVCGVDACIADVIAVTDDKLRELDGLGNAKLIKIHGLQQALRNGEYLDLPSSTEMTGEINQEILEPLSLDELEPNLIAAMDHFIVNLSEKDQYIFCKRHGIDCKQETLEEVGSLLPGGAVTRERVRQLQKRLDNDWPHHFGISPKQLWISIQDKLSLLRAPVFTSWRQRFDSEQGFFEFLEACCRVKPKRIRSITFPEVKKPILSNFWEANPSPASLGQVISFLEQEVGQEQAVLENMLVRLQKLDVIRIDSQGVSPLNLSKTEAFSHVLLMFPEGGDWKTLQQAVNDNGCCRVTFPLDRLDGSIGHTVDHGTIYQHARGSYRSTSYLNIADDQVSRILSAVKSELVSAKQAERSAIHLMTDFYNRHPQPEDYFTVRHIVRSYGEREGIFFSGKSGADTASLDSEFSLVSQVKAIVEYFSVKKGAFSTQDIAGIIRSQSISHASFYVEKLMTENLIIRVSESQYDLADRAFNDFDIKAIVTQAAGIVEIESRAIEGDILRKRINRALDISMNKYQCLSLLRLHAVSHGYNWSFCYNLVCRDEIKFVGLSDLVRQLMAEGYTENKELVQELDKKVLIDPSAISLVISNLRAELIRKQNNNLAETPKTTLEQDSPAGFSASYEQQMELKAQHDSNLKGKTSKIDLNRGKKSFISRASKLLYTAISERLGRLGIYDGRIVDASVEGDVFSIEGQQFDPSVAAVRARLIDQIKEEGFDLLVTAEAQRWFNRLCAIRYMEVNGYLSHGIRVLSHPSQPLGYEIIERADEISHELGLSRETVIDLRLAGDRDEELYRLLLLAQCKQLHQELPFMFPEQDDVTYLLLPNDLIRTDSFIHQFVEGVPEQLWFDLAIFSDLHNKYSSKARKKIGKTVARADLAIATRQDTPRWLVDFMVQNSLGRYWLDSTSESPLADQMSYFMPAEKQTDLVRQQRLSTTIKIQNPEQIKILDPCCGSGLILVEAYRVLKEIYLECGYRGRDIPQLILEKNLFCLDIDSHSTAMTSFVLLMAARADDRRIMSRNIRLNVHQLSVPQWDASETSDLRLQKLSDRFKDAGLLGYLLELPEFELSELNELAITYRDTPYEPLIRQGICLKQHYDIIAGHPPNMGTMRLAEDAELIRHVAREHYRGAEHNLATLFIERSARLLKPGAYSALLTKESWMFLGRYELLRNSLLSRLTIESMTHLAPGVIAGLQGQSATIFRNQRLPDYQSRFNYVGRDNLDSALQSPKVFPVQNERLVSVSISELKRVPGLPIAYWVHRSIQEAFSGTVKLGDVTRFNRPARTINRDQFTRLWHEVSYDELDITQGDVVKWNQFNAGGPVRRWYGNLDWVVSNEIAAPVLMKSSCSWTANADTFDARWMPSNIRYGTSGPCCAEGAENQFFLLGVFNSKAFQSLVSLATVTGSLGSLRENDVKNLPVCVADQDKIASAVRLLVDISKKDWHSSESAWGFKQYLIPQSKTQPLSQLFSELVEGQRKSLKHVQLFEERVNKLVIDAYGMQSALKPDVDLCELTLRSNPRHLYPKAKPTDAIEDWYQSDCMSGLVSFAIGCMMGRFSLWNEGLMSASIKGKGPTLDTLIAEGAYGGFKPDGDGIIPLTDKEWFADDATSRLVAFLKEGWGERNLAANIEFLAQSLRFKAVSPQPEEAALDTIRRYLQVQFYQDHLKTYSKRPIYWLFSSGKQKAFECLVYMHRYNEATLSRIRTEYVVPLLNKYDSLAEQLPVRIENALTIAESTRLAKEFSALKLKKVEIREFDDKLKHYADMRISLDLDEGVRENYGKFGDILADVKTIHGTRR